MQRSRVLGLRRGEAPAPVHACGLPRRHGAFGGGALARPRPAAHTNAYQAFPSDVDLPEAVERVVVSPVFRAAPWDPERLEAQEQDPTARILIISESDVCRSVIAAACLRQHLEEAGFSSEQVHFETRGTRPYSLGEGPEPIAGEAVEALCLAPPPQHAAAMFQPAADIVGYDLLLLMDRFIVEDVMREVSSFDLVNRSTQFSYKVRRLAEFAGGAARSPAVAAPAAGSPAATAAASPLAMVDDELDIGDPLYGNVGGPAEAQAVMRAARAIDAACRGLVAFLQDVQAKSAAAGEGAAVPVGPALRARVAALGPTPWLAPPMLSPRRDPDSLPTF